MCLSNFSRQPPVWLLSIIMKFFFQIFFHNVLFAFHFEFISRMSRVSEPALAFIEATLKSGVILLICATLKNWERIWNESAHETAQYWKNPARPEAWDVGIPCCLCFAMESLKSGNPPKCATST